MYVALGSEVIAPKDGWFIAAARIKSWSLPFLSSLRQHTRVQYKRFLSGICRTFLDLKKRERGCVIDKCDAGYRFASTLVLYMGLRVHLSQI